MPYDLFISYSRRDNADYRITQLVERIKTDFAPFAKRQLVPFFDQQEINGMQDWRQRILQGLRESRLLLACLSPAYLQSEYCEWEFVEYLKYEIGHLHGFNGVAPIYFVEVPGWDSKDFEQQCAAWIAELRKRQHFDLRPWHDHGEEALLEAAVQERMGKLNRQIVQTITRGERAEKSLGNVDAHNPHFIGRSANLRMLRENFVTPGHIGVVTAVNGLGGLGKTALAIEYAHAFADEYGGGRWQVRCAGKDDLRLALAELASPIGFEFTDDEKKNADLQFERVRRELKKLAEGGEPHRCLLILDNVDRPGMLDPAQVARLNAGDWLHVLGTTRLGENELHGAHKDRSFLAVDELPAHDALALIESYQPGGCIYHEAERDAAREIVRLLGCFTLAVESAAVYLGQFANNVTCAAFLARLKKEGLGGLDAAASQSGQGVLHGEKRLGATLRPTLERLEASEELVLEIVAQQASCDRIQLTSLRDLVVETLPEMEGDAQPGYPDPWTNVLLRLFSLRLIQTTDGVGPDCRPRFVRVHRLVQEFVRRQARTAVKKQRIRARLVLAASLAACVIVAVFLTGWFTTRSHGRLMIGSDPLGATILVAGNVLGQTPYDTFLPPGVWEVKIRKEGFLEQGLQVNLAKGRKAKYELRLTPTAGVNVGTSIKAGADEVTIVSLGGQVEVCPAESQQWESARANMVVGPMARIRTLKTSWALLRLDDGSVIRLSELAELLVQPPQHQNGINDVLRGVFYFFKRDKAGETKILTPKASAVIRG